MIIIHLIIQFILSFLIIYHNFHYLKAQFIANSYILHYLYDMIFSIFYVFIFFYIKYIYQSCLLFFFLHIATMLVFYFYFFYCIISTNSPKFLKILIRPHNKLHHYHYLCFIKNLLFLLLRLFCG